MSAFDPQQTLRALLDPRRNLLTIGTGIELGLAMKRREFIGLIGGAAAWPLATQAQQAANLKDLDGMKPRVYVVLGFGPHPIHKQVPNAPVVFTSIAVDPVTLGWVESYARPGGLVTGNVQNAVGGLESLMSKQFQFF